MEQSGISIITSNGATENSVGKSRSIGITLRTSSSIQAAKKKLKSSWLSSLIAEDATGWDTLIIGLAEMIGTAILVFIGCTGCIGSLNVVPSIFQISLTFGLAVMIAIQCIGHISGAHINPAITVAALILGKKSLPMAVLYIAAQCLGSLIGYSLLKAITPAELMFASTPDKANSFCMTEINEKLSVPQGFMAEMIGTGILVFFACGLWDHRNASNTDSVPMRFGFCVTVLCIIFIPYTGCSLNPARTLGPAVWNGYWSHHWIFWLAPITGALVASLLYRCLFLSNRGQSSGQNPGNLSGVET
ncbi:aquaporin AQPcic-like [Colletes gigas]|uniref:aquaporin AQPcic-like n=1 Tax=Colletes gigas TaxID=935657 RepID=UPI001C9A7D95|nr:aquaporin AQPcic-like [Colletes gigas]XP_043263263.1 aquaporin AQPcic-like [Colletes gigas]